MWMTYVTCVKRSYFSPSFLNYSHLHCVQVCMYTVMRNTFIVVVSWKPGVFLERNVWVPPVIIRSTVMNLLSLKSEKVIFSFDCHSCWEMPATMCSHPSFIIQLLCFLLTSSNLNSQSTSNSSDVLYNWTTAMASMQEEGSSCPECFQNMVGELDERFLLMKEEAMRNVKYLNDLRVIQSNFSDLHVILQSVLSSIADIKYSNTCEYLSIEYIPWKCGNQITLKRYDIERKCQLKFDRKSCMGFQIVNIFQTSGGSKVKVKPWTLCSQIYLQKNSR